MTVGLEKPARFAAPTNGVAAGVSGEAVTTPVDGSPPTSSEADGPTDEALADRWQGGSAEAFAELVGRFHQRLFHFLFQATGRRHDAEDLTQETFLAAHRSIGRYSAGRTFGPWLFGIARHAVASHWRRRRSTETLPEDFEERPGPEADPAGAAETGDDRQALWQIARRLKPAQFQVLWLRYGEDFDVAEVARAMGITRIHTKVLLYRARNELARRLNVRPGASGGRR